MTETTEDNPMLAVVHKAFKDNDTEEPTQKQLFDSLMSLHTVSDDNDEFWGNLLVHATIELNINVL